MECWHLFLGLATSKSRIIITLTRLGSRETLITSAPNNGV